MSEYTQSSCSGAYVIRHTHNSQWLAGTYMMRETYRQAGPESILLFIYTDMFASSRTHCHGLHLIMERMITNLSRIFRSERLVSRSIEETDADFHYAAIQSDPITIDFPYLLLLNPQQESAAQKKCRQLSRALCWQF